MSQPKLLINTHKLNLIIKRFALQLIEMHGDFSQSAIIGLQPRGVNLAKKLADFITEIQPENSLKYGELDHTFFRDDIGRGEPRLFAGEVRTGFTVGFNSSVTW